MLELPGAVRGRGRSHEASTPRRREEVEPQSQGTVVSVVALSDLGLGKMDQQHTPGLSNGKTRDGEEEYRVYLFAPESWFYTTLLAFDNVFLTSI